MPAFFATAPAGLVPLLVEELHALGAVDARASRAGVRFSGSLELAYRACLWSRLANRILYPLAEFPATDSESLYRGVYNIDWSQHLDADRSFAVDCTLVKSTLNHSQFVARRVKDAVVDQFRARSGQRPRVAVDRPDVRLHCHIESDLATLSLDLAGESLHRRGYRGEQGEAPLKENLAAAILLRAGWPAIAARGGALADPMCGSGTLLIEGALLAADIAPGLLRDYYGFLGWRGHDTASWRRLLDEAHARRATGMEHLPPICGSDRDARAIRNAAANAARAGVEHAIRFSVSTLDECAPAGTPAGLVVTNPPYGERLGTAAALPVLYRSLGRALKRCYPGWRAALFTAAPEYAPFLGLRADRTHTFYNGPLKCRLLQCEIGATPVPAGGAAADFGNRLRKNLRRLGRWAEREGVACYRVYDADLPDYNLAIDIYDNQRRHVHVQEYEAPAHVDAHRAQARLNAALAMIMDILEVDSDAVHFKRRRRQRGGRQYEKLGTCGAEHIVREGDNRFLVNFEDYLDTGLFLDHRLIRRYIRQQARDRRFLNLFGYTGTATVCAARGGARASITVDLSKTYLDWAQRNLLLNRLAGAQHRFVQADVLQWLRDYRGGKFDLIFVDPPSFSRSKRMSGIFDVQRDHVALLRACMSLLADQGELIFSTNLRRFRLETGALDDYAIEDITRRTLPEDFARSPHIHHGYRLQWPAAARRNDQKTLLMPATTR